MADVKIKAFGITREILGGSEIVIEMPVSVTVAVLRAELEKRYPELTNLKSLFVAVNNEYAEEEMIVQQQDEVALIPPVSGG